MTPPLSSVRTPEPPPNADAPAPVAGCRPPAAFLPVNSWLLVAALAALHVTNPNTWGMALPYFWFPATGVALCLVAWFGWRAAVLVLFDGLLVIAQVALIAYFRQGDHSFALVLISADAMLNPAEVLVAWWLYHSLARGARIPADPTSATLFLVLVGGVTLGLGALVRATLYGAFADTPVAFGNVVVWFWLSRSLGVVAVAPALLATVTPWLVRRGFAVDERIDRAQATDLDRIGAERIRQYDWLEIGGTALAAGLVSLLLASPFARKELAGWQLGSVPLLLILWASARQGVRGGAAVAAFSTALTLLFTPDLARGDGFTLLLQATLLAQCGVAVLVASSSRWIRFQEARYRQVVGHIPVVIYSARIRNPPGDAGCPAAEITLVSAASRLLLGCQPDELLGDYERWLDRVHPEDREVLRAARAQVARQDEPVTCEYRLNEPEPPLLDSSALDRVAPVPGLLPRRPTARWLRDTLAPRRDGAGRCVGWEGVVVDISEQRALADDLRRATSLFNALVSNLPAGVFFVQGRRGRPLLVNARARQLLGQREDTAASVEHLCQTYRLHRPDGSPYPVDELPVVAALRRGRTTMRDDIVVHRPDGRRVPLVTWGAAVRLGYAADGSAAVWVLEDLTALHQAEAARRDTEVRLRTIIETMGEGLVVLDRNAIVVDCNQAAGSLFGLPLEQLRGQSMLRLPLAMIREDGLPLPPEEFPSQVVLRTRRPVRNQILGLRATAAADAPPTRWLLVHAMPLGGDDGVAGVVITFADITALRQAQEVIRASEEKYRGLIEALPCMLIQTDLDMRVRYINPVLESVTGYCLDEITEVDGWQRLLHPDDLAKTVALARAALDGTPGRLEFRYKAKDGTDRIGYAMAQPTRQRGVVVGVTTTVVDLTRQRLLEEKLQRVQRLELIGRLSSGIAHDFNNLLTIVMQLTALARDNLPAQHPVHEELLRINEVSEQAAQLTAQLLAISKHRAVKLQRLELNGHVRRTLKLLRSTLPSRIDLTAALDEHDLPVRADESQLQQVVMNLCLNARDAMPEGGKLVVATDADGPPNAPGRWVHLTVQDDGQGMSEAVRARMFEPFFSGKERGTGLGLTIVQQVVESCGGRIKVTSEPGAGARFDVWLPWATETGPEVAELPSATRD